MNEYRTATSVSSLAPAHRYRTAASDLSLILAVPSSHTKRLAGPAGLLCSLSFLYSRAGFPFGRSLPLAPSPLVRGHIGRSRLRWGETGPAGRGGRLCVVWLPVQCNSYQLLPLYAVIKRLASFLLRTKRLAGAILIFISSPSRSGWHTYTATAPALYI